MAPIVPHPILENVGVLLKTSNANLPFIETVPDSIHPVRPRPLGIINKYNVPNSLPFIFAAFLASVCSMTWFASLALICFMAWFAFTALMALVALIDFAYKCVY